MAFQRFKYPTFQVYIQTYNQFIQHKQQSLQKEGECEKASISTEGNSINLYQNQPPIELKAEAESYAITDNTISEDYEEYKPEQSRRRSRATMRDNARTKKNDRKIRTTITLQKIQNMNKLFNQYEKQRQNNHGSTQHSLRSIGQQLFLGYSTILHKYRQFRQTKEVKGGALIQSLNKKRKYKKSLQIQNYIKMALEMEKFQSAVQLSKFIYQQYGKVFSRSIISRHLSDLNVNLQSGPLQSQKSSQSQKPSKYPKPTKVAKQKIQKQYQFQALSGSVKIQDLFFQSEQQN